MAAGVRTQVTPEAIFNELGTLPLAAEQDLGLALVRELLAADALANGRLARLPALSITDEQAQSYHLAVTTAPIGHYLQHDYLLAPAPDVTGTWFSLDQHFVNERGEAKWPRPPITGKAGWPAAP